MKEGSHCICLLVIFIDFVFKIGTDYYYHIGDELELSSDDFRK